MSTTVHRLTPDRIPDFFRIHSESHEAGWCFCAAWWVPTWEGWGDRTATENRAVREHLFARGELDGYLLYEADQPVGWCQVGPRDRLAKLVAQFDLAPDPATWAITCFLIPPDQRGQGRAAALLAGVLQALPERGARRLEAFPKRGPDLDAPALWNGPERLFRAAGFAVVREDAVRPVLAYTWPEE